MDHRSNDVRPVSYRHRVGDRQRPSRHYARGQGSHNGANRGTRGREAQRVRCPVSRRDSRPLSSNRRQGSSYIKNSSRVSLIRSIFLVLIAGERGTMSVLFRLNAAGRRRVGCRRRCNRVSNRATSSSRRRLPCLQRGKSDERSVKNVRRIMSNPLLSRIHGVFHQLSRLNQIRVRVLRFISGWPSDRQGQCRGARSHFRRRSCDGRTAPRVFLFNRVRRLFPSRCVGNADTRSASRGESRFRGGGHPRRCSGHGREMFPMLFLCVRFIVLRCCAVCVWVAVRRDNYLSSSIGAN